MVGYEYEYDVIYTDSEGGDARTTFFSSHPVTEDVAAQVIKEQLHANGVFVEWVDIVALMQVE
jgi:hypothetical protein